MELIKIILFSLAALSLLCAWLVPRQLRKRWEAKYKRKKNQNTSEDIRGYATLGELPADYLDKALDRATNRILIEIRMAILEIRDTMWQMMFIFLAIILTAISLTS